MLYGLVAYLLWGALTVYWKLLHTVDPFELIGQRVLYALVILGAVVWATRAGPGLRAAFRDRRTATRLVGAGVLLAANWTSYVWAIHQDNVVETALGYFIAPLGTVVVGVVFLQERLRSGQKVALTIVAGGVVFLIVAYGAVPWMALIIAGSWSFYGLLKKQLPLTAVQGLTAENLMLAPMALAVLAGRLATGTSAYHTESAATIALVTLTGVVTVVPLLLFAAASRRLPLSTLGPLQYLVPTINFALGVWAYGEQMPPERLIGFAIVWTGLIILTVDGLRAARRSATAARPPAPPGPSTKAVAFRG